MFDSNFDMEVRVTALLRGLGVPAHVKGYEYVREAIMLCLADSTFLGRLTKGLYPTVAGKFGSTPQRVERAIRHAVEIACERGDIDLINEIFGYTMNASKGKPTNWEFIATVTDTLKLELRRNVG